MPAQRSVSLLGVCGSANARGTRRPGRDSRVHAHEIVCNQTVVAQMQHIPRMTAAVEHRVRAVAGERRRTFCARRTLGVASRSFVGVFGRCNTRKDSLMQRAK